MEIFKIGSLYYTDRDQAIIQNPGSAKSIQTINTGTVEGQIVCVNEDNEFFLRDDNWKFDKQIEVHVSILDGDESRTINIDSGTDFYIFCEDYEAYIDNINLDKLSLSDELKKDISREIENYISRTNKKNHKH